MFSPIHYLIKFISFYVSHNPISYSYWVCIFSHYILSPLLKWIYQFWWLFFKWLTQSWSTLWCRFWRWCWRKSKWFFSFKDLIIHFYSSTLPPIYFRNHP